MQHLGRRFAGLRLAAVLGLTLVACDDGGATDLDADASRGPDGGVSPPVSDASARDANAQRDATQLDGQTRPPEGDARSEADAHGGEHLDASPTRDGALSEPPPDAQTESDASAGRVPVFVAVGYSGLRVVSRDLGQTWQDMTTSGGGGDDEHLLRGVTIGDGLIVAIGWKIWTSADGASWTERDNTVGQWMGGIRYGNGVFVAAGGYGTSTYSSDGITWQAGSPGNRTDNDPARTVAFGDGIFVAATDDYRWWQTSDGKVWTQQPTQHGSSDVMWCSDAFREPKGCNLPEARNNGLTAKGEGVYVSVGYNKLERSTDGQVWSEVFEGSVANVAFGYLE